MKLTIRFIIWTIKTLAKILWCTAMALEAGCKAFAFEWREMGSRRRAGTSNVVEIGLSDTRAEVLSALKNLKMGDKRAREILSSVKMKRGETFEQVFGECMRRGVA